MLWLYELIILSFNSGCLGDFTQNSFFNGLIGLAHIRIKSEVLPSFIYYLFMKINSSALLFYQSCYSNILYVLKRQLLWLTDGHFSSDEILHFLEYNKFPLVTIMTELNSAKVYSSTNKLQVALPSITVTDSFAAFLCFHFSCLWKFS